MQITKQSIDSSFKCFEPPKNKSEPKFIIRRKSFAFKNYRQVFKLRPLTLKKHPQNEKPSHSNSKKTLLNLPVLQRTKTSISAAQYIENYEYLIKEFAMVLYTGSKPLSIGEQEVYDDELKKSKQYFQCFALNQDQKKYSEHLQKWNENIGCPNRDGNPERYNELWLKADKVSFINPFQACHETFLIQEREQNCMEEKEKFILYQIQKISYSREKYPEARKRIHLGILYSADNVLGCFLWVTNYYIPIEKNCRNLQSAIRQLQRLVNVDQPEKYSMMVYNVAWKVQEVGLRILMSIGKKCKKNAPHRRIASPQKISSRQKKITERDTDMIIIKFDPNQKNRRRILRL